MRLSVLIPVYNERTTIASVIAAVVAALPATEKEIIIVDDCSTDGTGAFLKDMLGSATGRYRQVSADNGRIALTEARDGEPGVSFQVLYHSRNRGKGGALRSAMQAVKGDVIIIQDADLEYDPQDWVQMYDLIAVRKVADVVYGSRFYGRPHRSLFYHHYLANRLISFLLNVLYNQTLTDVETCYKMFTRDVLNTFRLTCDDFGIEIEITAQIALNRKLRIYETGISYFGRTYDEGKKINWRDGLKALWYIVKFRF